MHEWYKTVTAAVMFNDIAVVKKRQHKIHSTYLVRHHDKFWQVSVCDFQKMSHVQSTFYKFGSSLYQPSGKGFANIPVIRNCPIRWFLNVGCWLRALDTCIDTYHAQILKRWTTMCTPWEKRYRKNKQNCRGRITPTMAWSFHKSAVKLRTAFEIFWRTTKIDQSSPKRT